MSVDGFFPFQARFEISPGIDILDRYNWTIPDTQDLKCHPISIFWTDIIEQYPMLAIQLTKWPILPISMPKS